ncbi:endopeptidase La [Pontiella sulfatireligans]|uniref:Lon protease n=1 Tax=Pontiella sulfatireligans TaxID=2750658 RepID=A0A6C2URV5_9BACT|nr:endopeptidase La [Pontiella sulfatireligans]VGO22869.1 Lon protease 2 [Pontiella sulfatireligans]
MSAHEDTTDVEIEVVPEQDVPDLLPVMPLKNFVLFPQMVTPLVITTDESKKLVTELSTRTPHFITTLQRKDEIDETNLTKDDVYRVGCVARMIKTLNFPDGSTHILVEGLSRCELQDLINEEEYPTAHYNMIEDAEDDSLELEALGRNASEQFQHIVTMSPNMPDELSIAIFNMESASQLSDLIATNLPVPVEVRQKLLADKHPANRLKKLMEFLNRELQILKLGSKIENKVHETFSKTQREIFLREQLKAIQTELGEDDPQANEILELEKKLAEAQLPKEAGEAAEKELQRLKAVSSASPEHGVIRTYLDVLSELPWEKSTEDHLDILAAQKILDKDHYGLEKVKERILEYLSVLKLKKDMKGPILCLAGPPGVGKTSLGKSVARALGREFVRMSLGGMHDEAEIRGHRRTYIGAMPGRIIESIRRCGANNPVFMLDEIDKVGSDFRGDPASALLEVLDPEQNSTFNDHYLDVEFDLSKVLFITTANMLDTIPGPLRDRMEIIRISGYTLQEKVNIARRYLVPKAIREHGLKRTQIKFNAEALEGIISGYTAEAGVRSLERQIANVCRKVARGFAEGKTRPVEVTGRKIKGFLGPVKVDKDVAERDAMPGVVTGLAWTPYGGDILFIEATCMAGKGGLILTGSLGDVMKESARAALSYLRANAATFKIDEAVFAKSDIHIHVPAGATPKDGPSAGVAISLAILSMLQNKPVRPDLAMTGEISLRGRVLPIGGLKEKVLAASRAGIKHIMLPEKNKIDLAEIPADVKKKLTFKTVKNIDQALRYALKLSAE